MSEMNRSKPEVDFVEGPPPSELVVTDLEVGSGAEATPGATVDSSGGKQGTVTSAAPIDSRKLFSNSTRRRSRSRLRPGVRRPT